jgi:hypothetical protein
MTTLFDIIDKAETWNEQDQAVLGAIRGVINLPEVVYDFDRPLATWQKQARRIARKHAHRDNWFHSRRWHCACGACRAARSSGFNPRQNLSKR